MFKFLHFLDKKGMTSRLILGNLIKTNSNGSISRFSPFNQDKNIFYFIIYYFHYFFLDKHFFPMNKRNLLLLVGSKCINIFILFGPAELA